jgi:tryptophan-rich sensory protein
MRDSATDHRASAALRRRAVLWAALAAIAVAGLGGLATDLGPWYASLRQPPWKPHDALFGPAWTLIYACAAMAGVKAWEADPRRAARDTLLALFFLNGFLNLLWSLLFFRLQRPDWALMEVGALWLSILALILWTRPRSRAASRLLWPYLAWVSFAAVLNAAVVELNGPFPSAALRLGGWTV